MRYAFFVVVAATLVGCSYTSGVVSSGKGTFIVARSEKGFATTGSRVKADALREAGDYCMATGKTVELVTADSADMRPFRSDAQAEIEFRCVPTK